MAHVKDAVHIFIDQVSSVLGMTNLTITLVDVIEILIVSFLFYHVLIWVKSTRAWKLFKGILVILIFVLLAALFQMNTILWIAENTLNVGLIAVVVIFQPELRNVLENIGDRNILSSVFSFGKQEEMKISDHTIDELVKATFAMGKVKTGALIVIEDEILLNEYIRTGIDVDAIVSSQLLINIFEKNTPLHDGAIIVRGDRVVSATCYLPLSDSLSLSKDLGTRHRAAIGISEVSDALIIIVSEETGAVSVALRGQIYRHLDAELLRERLKAFQKPVKPKETSGGMELIKRRFKNEKENSESLDE
uniref:diadenylate cyclase CdaA n=1 Tax=Agathobacter sp. TaxID=2021311 RepID=UPI0040572A69